MKRKDYISWDDYFMGIALLSAKRSKDPETQVGACIIDKNNRIVGVGYNGLPLGCSDDEFPWGKDDKDVTKTKKPFVCHAELNAIMNGSRKGKTMFVTLFPCNECAKLIIQSRIRKVIYLKEKHPCRWDFRCSKIMLDAAGVTLTKFSPKLSQLTLEF